MITDKLHVGVIGLGAIGKRVLQSFIHHPQITICAICDVDLDRATNAANQLGEEVFCSIDYREMLVGDHVDLVYVAVPPQSHAPIVLDVLKARKHILCEKPLALTLQEAQEMDARARASGVVHALNLPLIYNSGVSLLHEKKVEGYLGQVQQLEISMTFPSWPRRWQVNPWIGTRAQGGPVRECCPHFFHLILREYGPVMRVFARMQYPKALDECEISASGLLELANGQIVSITILCGIAQPERVAFIQYGTKGTLSLLNWDEPIGWKEKSGYEQFSIVQSDEHTLLLNNLLKAIEGEQANLAGFHEGLAVQEVLEAWYRSSISGQWETI